MNNSKVSRNVLPCHFPWTSMYISPNGDVTHCCSTNLNSLGNIAELSVDEVWNGKLYQTVRKRIAVGDFNGAFCNPNCHGLRTKEGYPWPERIDGSRVIEDNQDKAFYNFKNDIEKVDHFPLNLKLEFSNQCNFRCVMCYYEFKPPYDFIPDIAIKKLLEIATYASTVSLMGGEVFMNKRDLQFIDGYNQQEGSNMTFITNASLLNDKMIERLKKFKKMGMQISIDGTEKVVFEKVRRNGKWEVVDANIRRIVKTSNEVKKDNYNWDISLAYAVMASNLSNLAHALEYSIKLNIFIGFHPVKGFHLFDENIFTYRNALESTGNWNKHIDNVFIVIEREKDKYIYYNEVKSYLEEIKRYLEKPKINAYSGTVKFLKKLIKDKDGKAQGLSQANRRLGHLIEVYYNLKVGNTSFGATFKYVIVKGFRYIKLKLLSKKKSRRK